MKKKNKIKKDIKKSLKKKLRRKKHKKRNKNKLNVEFKFTVVMLLIATTIVFFDRYFMSNHPEN